MKFKLSDDKENILYIRAKDEFEAIKKARKQHFNIKQITALTQAKHHNLKPKELIFLFKQFSILLDVGMSFLQICEQLKTSFKQKNIQIFLKNIQSSLQSGQSLSLAFSNHGFKKNEVALIKMGENTANLAFVFEQLATLTQQKLQYKKQLQKALSYPCFVFMSLIIAFCVIVLFVIPKFEQIFLEFGANLPFITRVLLQSYDFLNNYHLILITLFAIFCLIFMLFYHHIKTFKLFIHSLLMRTPIVSSLIFYSQNAVFFKIFSLLIHSNIPLIKALNLAQSSFSNLYLEQKIKLIQKHCKSGLSLELAFEKVKIYDNFVLSMIKTAMNSSKLDFMSEKIANYFELKQEDLNSLFITMLEPFMTLLVCVLVLILALGIFLPLWQLNEIVAM